MLHVVLFEGGLLVLYLPMVAWYLNISLWHALPTRSSMMHSTPFAVILPIAAAWVVRWRRE
ncbi:chlorhexidine efflux transporter [Psychrobacter celer]|uniref:chlorhexidine efflux transporter n=1 Tax=Psychrobacter celer TaxID=306572 RepID=UPI003FD16458